MLIPSPQKMLTLCRQASIVHAYSVLPLWMDSVRWGCAFGVMGSVFGYWGLGWWGAGVTLCLGAFLGTLMHCSWLWQVVQSQPYPYGDPRFSEHVRPDLLLALWEEYQNKLVHVSHKAWHEKIAIQGYLTVADVRWILWGDSSRPPTIRGRTLSYFTAAGYAQTPWSILWQKTLLDLVFCSFDSSSSTPSLHRVSRSRL